MRGSLHGVRTRVKRLAGQVRVGCSACREDEARVRFCWHDVLAHPSVGVTDVLANEPEAQTCAACGRAYVCPVTMIGWQTDPPDPQPASARR